MKRFLFLLVAFAAFKAEAQDFQPQSMAFSLGGEIAITSHSAYNTGWGFSGKFDIPVAKPVSLSLTAGYTRLGFKEALIGGSSRPPATNFVPLKAGAKVFSGGFFIEAEAGAAIETNYNKDKLFAFAIGPGFIVPLGDSKQAIEFGFRYERWAKRLTQTGIRVAYRIGW